MDVAIDNAWIKLLVKMHSELNIESAMLARTMKKLEEFAPKSRFQVFMLMYALHFFYQEIKLGKLSRIFSYLDNTHTG